MHTQEQANANCTHTNASTHLNAPDDDDGQVVRGVVQVVEHSGPLREALWYQQLPRVVPVLLAVQVRRQVG